MKKIGDAGNKYLGILEYDKVKEVDIKDISKGILKETGVSVESKLNGKNKILSINTWAVAVW